MLLIEYFRVIKCTMCSLSKFCWSIPLVPSPLKCSGDCVLLTELDTKALKTLLNRITPYSVELSTISGFSVCKFHLKWFTYNHPCLKLRKCSIEEDSVKCTNSATYAKSVRVSLPLSEHIFATTQQHIPAGTGICRKHCNLYQEQLKCVTDFVEEDARFAISSMITPDVPESSQIYQPSEAVSQHPPAVLSENLVHIDVVSHKEDISSNSQPCDSQEMHLSQASNWSSSSENLSSKLKSPSQKKAEEIKVVKLFMESIGHAFPESLLRGINPSSLPTVLKSQIEACADLVLDLVNVLVWDCEVDSKIQFCSYMMMAIGQKSSRPELIIKADLALNILDSLKDYYQFALKDLTWNGIATRKVILESISGSALRENSQLSLAADVIGARKKSLYNASATRKSIEDNFKIIPLVEKLARKPPSGDGFVSDEWKLKAVLFYESKSELIKGHNNLFKEKVKGDLGQSDVVILRPKRVLQIQLIQMLSMARSDINWPFGLRSLLSLRPPWVLLPSSRYIIGCLCELCQNVSLLLRAIFGLITWLCQFGTEVEANIARNMNILPTVSGFLDLVLHSKIEGKSLNDYDCFNQTCSVQENGLCGLSKMKLVFEDILIESGNRVVEYFEHIEVEYTRPDQKQGKRWELKKLSVSLTELVSKLGSKVFSGKRETFLVHQLKKQLASNARQEMRKSLSDDHVIVYSDYSKELPLIVPEEIKSAAFGASNTTIQVIPQVYELAVVPPSAPQELMFDESLSFSSPKYLGGSRISGYEVHIEDPDTGDWYLLECRSVQPLTPEPDLSSACQLSSLRGSFHIRVAARNLAGLGQTASLSIEAHGKKVVSILWTFVFK